MPGEQHDSDTLLKNLHMKERKLGMLVVYCLKNMNLFAGTHGIPEILASAAVVGLHVWKRNTLLSIAVGTVFYMFLVQVVF